VTQAVAQACSGEECVHTLGGAVEASGENPLDSIRGFLLGCRALELLIGLRKGYGTGVLGVASMPDHPATDDCGEIHLVSKTAAVLFIHQEIPGQWQTTSCQHRYQTLGAECADQAQAVKGHR
jgi:hypothetical protein